MVPFVPGDMVQDGDMLYFDNYSDLVFIKEEKTVFGEWKEVGMTPTAECADNAAMARGLLCGRGLSYIKALGHYTPTAEDARYKQ